jgi:hypothetical protein
MDGSYQISVSLTVIVSRREARSSARALRIFGYLRVGSWNFKCVQQRAGGVIDTDELRHFYQSPLSESTLGCTVKSRVNMVLS